MQTVKILTVVFPLLLCVSSANADWARFRGPNGTGVSESELPVSWTPTQNVAWKTALPGPGVSSPIVVGDRIFVTCYSGYGLERQNPGDIKDLVRHLVCVDSKSGKKLWQKDIAATQPEDPYSGIGVVAHGYASHTPVSDGEMVYVFFGKSGAYAFDLDGKQIWHATIGSESDPWKWGSSSSPVVHDDLVIVTAAAESQAIVGLDKKTGKEVWRQEASGLDGMWGTPALVKSASGQTDLVMSVAKEMWGIDPSSGQLRWFCTATGADQTHSSPIAANDTVYAFTGRGGGSVAVTAGGKGDVTESHVKWNGTDSTRFASPVAHGERLYLVASGVASVIDADSGKRIKQVRLRGGSGGGGGRGGGSDYGSPVIAGDKLYYVNGKGEAFVFELGDDLQQLSVNLVTTDGESFGGTPAISDKRMYLRSDKNLYCVADSGVEVVANASKDLIASVEEPDAGEGPRGGGRRGPGGGPGGRGGRFDPAAMFKQQDTNNDEKLSKDEVQGPMADRFAEIDKDGDEAISLQEFQDGLRSMFRGGGRGGRGGGGGGGRRGGPGSDNDSRPKRPQRPEMVS